MKRRFYDIAADYATIPITRVPKVKVGVVARFMSNTRRWATMIWKNFWKVRLRGQPAGLMGFVEYCVANYKLDIDLYGGNKLVAGGADASCAGWTASAAPAMTPCASTASTRPARSAS